MASSSSREAASSRGDHMSARAGRSRSRRNRSTVASQVARVSCARVAFMGGVSSSGAFQAKLLGRSRIRKRGDQRQAAFRHPGPDPPDEAVLPDRGEDLALVQDPLDLEEQLLALLPVDLARLALEQVLYLGQDTVRILTALDGHALDAGGGIAACPLRAQHDAAEL